MYVNPAGKRRRTKKVRRRVKARPAVRRVARKAAPKRRNAAKKKTVAKKRVVRKAAPKKRAAKKNTATKKSTRSSRANRKTAAKPRRKTTMAKKKRARKAPARKRVARKNPSAKRRAAAKKAVATRRRKALARSRAAKRAAATRRRKARKNPPRKRKSVSRKRSGMTKAARSRAAKKGWARRRRASGKRRNPRKTTVKSLARARRSIRSKYKTPMAKAWQKRFKMRSNQAGIKDAFVKALPIAAGYVGSKMLAGVGRKYIPGLDKLSVAGYDLSKPVLAAGAIAVTHFATKKGPKMLKSRRDQLMLGAGLGLVDAMIQTFAPASVKDMLGMKSEKSEAMSPEAAAGYVTMDGYVAIGDAPPLDDNITLDGYVQVGEFESEMGMIEADLGEFQSEMGMVEADLGNVGGFANRHLGGTHRNQMLAPVPSRPVLAPVPPRSWTGAVPPINPGYDQHQGLYRGIFSGGYQ